MFKRIILLLLAAAVAASVAFSGADAGQRFKRKVVIKNSGVFVINTYAGRNHRHHTVGDTYSGDVAIIVRRGVGQWSYGTVARTSVSTLAIPNAKIIDVARQLPGAACQMQAGVCVIKP